MGVPGSANPMLLAGGAAAYEIDQSLRFNSADSAYLNRTPGSAGNRKTWTWSGWVKRGALSVDQTLFEAGNGSGNVYTLLWFNSSDKIGLVEDRGSGGVYYPYTTAVFRDASAWYHIVVSVDTTQATSTNRIKIYVNGVQQTIDNSYPAQNDDTHVNSTNAHRIGYRTSNSAALSAYLAEINFIDGSALTPSSFGETDTTTGAWIPKRYSGSYTGNSFYLKFASGDGTDSSGLSNTWTANNFTTSGTGTDVMSDTPTTNWCTLNPLSSNATLSLSNGNLDTPSNQDNKANNGTIGVNSGKWYWEITVNSNSKPCPFIGVTSYSQENDPDVSPAINADTRRSVIRLANAYIYKNYTGTSTATGATNEGTTGTIGVALNFDAGEIKYYRDNNLVHTDSTIPTNGTTLFPYIGVTFSGSSGWQSTSFNFGQRAFAYTPPTGFKALNTANLPEPTIKDGGKYFATTLWTGNSATRTITVNGIDNVGFAWLKARSINDNHTLANVVVGGDKYLKSNSTDAELSSSLVISAISSNTFTVGSDAQTNRTGDTYVGWTWAAGGTGSSNNAGSVTSTVSANASAGFSIVTWSNEGTVGHGLGVAPSFIIVKSRNQTSGWWVYASALGNSNYGLPLHSTAAVNTSINWGGAPTSSVFYVSPGQAALPSTSNNVAYCFSEVAGYSKFGSYTGNGSSDGPFVFTGFKIAWLMWKRTDSTANWFLMDAARNTYNVVDKEIYPDRPDAENTFTDVDFLSNGFKLRASAADRNASGGTFVYAAFAELPFKYSTAR